VGVDRPDESDVPPDGHPDRQDDQSANGARAARSANTPAETRSRQECYNELHAADAASQAAATRQASAEEQVAWAKWQKDSAESRWMWSEYQRKWPPEERPQPDRPKDKPGYWYGEGNRELDPATDARVEAACDQIAKREEDKITPAMRDRYLERSPYNLIRIELGKELPGDTETNNKYTRAGDLLQAWLRDGILHRSEKPALYYLEQTFAAPDDSGKTS